ncbi:MAG TPA: L-threonylcarbamoyladenylate synthase [Bacteroidales bacterium]|jgi:L-threonylcarbamoyladenylate synthase
MTKFSFEEDLARSIVVLKKGGTILYPTDTIWGIGCDATNPKAVEKVYALKRRAESKSLIILLDSFDKIARYVEKVPDVAYDLVSNMESPLTIIYSSAKNLAPNVIASDGTIAIRVVNEEFCRQLITRFGKPIVSSSANIAGDSTPLTFSSIIAEIVKNVDYVVNLKHDIFNRSKPSTIIRLFENGEFTIIRQ